MRKLFILGLFFVSLSAYAQGFYLDIGLGMGVKQWTNIGDNDINNVLNLTGSGIKSAHSAFAGLKAGYGPFDNIPLYFVLELTGVLNAVSDNGENRGMGVFWNNYYSIMAGPGVIFYPFTFIQIGSSICYASTYSTSQLQVRLIYEDIVSYNTGWMSGLAWNVSLAFDPGILWKGNHSVLLGVNYYYLNNVFKQAGFNGWNSSWIGIFLKYTYRKKPASLF